MDWKEKIDMLSKRLDELYETPATADELKDKWFDSDLSEEIGWEAYDVLTAECRPIWERIHYLEEKGYICRHGEIDSFGWLNGIIEQAKPTDPRKLCFG
ncbi:MAG: hypothetical protein K2F99_09530 [Muribaculaceae bacterium]|nr:hypothetical protein [Muribaculaceae bacterium]